MSKGKRREVAVDEVAEEWATAEIIEPEEVTGSEPEPELDAPVHLVGVVTNCQRLNCRRRPEADAPVDFTLECLTEVQVDEKASTDKFYKIYTSAGFVGYCMKQYISIRR